MVCGGRQCCYKLTKGQGILNCFSTRQYQDSVTNGVNNWVTNSWLTILWSFCLTQLYKAQETVCSFYWLWCSTKQHQLLFVDNLHFWYQRLCGGTLTFSLFQKLHIITRRNNNVSGHWYLLMSMSLLSDADMSCSLCEYIIYMHLRMILRHCINICLIY